MCASTASRLSGREFHREYREILLVAEPARLARRYYYKWEQFRELHGGGEPGADESGYNFNKSARLCSSVPARRIKLSRVALRRVASRRFRLPSAATHSHGGENSAKSLGTNSLSAAQHRRWNPRRNFRFRRGSRALAEPKDDRSASEIVRDNSPPCGFLFSFSFSLLGLFHFTLPRIRLFSLAPLSFSIAEVYLFVFPSTLASSTPASLCND